MRKLVLSLSILAILVVAVFCIGWIQFQVEPGHYAVIRSKTNGTHAKILRPGRFAWTWERLLPTNVRVYSFTIERITRDAKSTGTLPAAEQFASLLDLKADFAYEIEITVSFLLDPEHLPALVSEENIETQEQLSAWLSQRADSVSEYAMHRLTVYSQDEQQRRDLVLHSAGANLEQDLARAFPELTSITCLVKSVRMPDLAAYEAARALYLDFLTRRKAALASQAPELNEANIRLQRRLEELELTGELLNKYPVLIKYLALQAAARDGTLDVLGLMGD